MFQIFCRDSAEMSTKTILLFCFIVTSVAFAEDTGKNTENEDEQLQQPPPPPFAKGASANAIKQLQEIYADPYQTKQELFDRVEAWANEQGSEIAANYYRYMEEAQNFHKKLVAKLSNAKLDSVLKEVIERILGMGEDRSKTIEDELSAVKRIQESLSPEQVAEIGKFLFSADE
uniref:SXP/RAL-2 family protein Ani s 5-like cation-binding domain-containing protein n=1 Tax=Parascaris univalens TaxID=6257 RepID=A0A914ZIX6_PARUN